MPKIFFGLFISLILFMGIVGLISGKVDLLGFIFGIVAFTILESLRRKSEKKKKDVEYDERVMINIYKFTAMALLVSISLLLMFLTINSFLFETTTIKINYLMFYLVLTFYVSLFLGPVILKNK